jgi:tetratricopeptide (TPR) repeat protein
MLPLLVPDVSLPKGRITHFLVSGVVACGLLIASHAKAQALPTEALICPDLASYYSEMNFTDAASDEPARWAALTTTLAELQSRCLRSSEYYALLGAAQLNSGQLDVASESLERALLLDPKNGSAQIDYAEALFAAGQLFPALQLNETILGREDLPAELRETLTQREADWRKNTKQHILQLDLQAGYDNNLNSAPGADQITLTLSGEPVLLSLNTDLQPQEGAFTNARLSSTQLTLTANGQHSWTNQVRGRLSQDTRSDLLQFDSRYALIKPTRRRTLQWEAGASSLFFGGSALYTSAQTRLSYQPNTNKRCAPVYEIASQYQRFHSQNTLDAWESKATLGASCVAGENTNNPLRIGFDGGYISNRALDSTRPGDDRDGWQVNVRAQRALFGGELSAQASYTRLEDAGSYSPILVNGAARWQERNQFLIQHRTPMRLGTRSALFLVNFYHQDQSSNIELFELSDTAVELGFSIAL